MVENTDFLLDIDDDIPTGPVDIEITDEKPFNRCLACQYLGCGCSGPNLNVMSVERVCEFFQLRRKQLHYSYQRVADDSQLSVVTVKRTLNAQVKDPGFLTVQSLAFALRISSPNDKSPCAMHIVTKEQEKTITQCQALQEQLARQEKEYTAALEAEQRKTTHLKQQVQFDEEQIKGKDKLIQERFDFLSRKDRVITILAILLGIAVLIIIAALVIDKTDPNVGFFWRDNLAAVFKNSALFTNYGTSVL